MKQKKKSFHVLSNVKCAEPGCRKHLKANLVERKPTARFCFKHYWQHRLDDESTMPTAWNLTAAGRGRQIVK